MTARRMVLIAVVWALSLVAVAHWSANGQGTPPTGKEVRFLTGESKPGRPVSGTLVANFDGQWLPVTLSTLSVPDGNIR